MAKRFRHEDQIALVQLISAVTQFDDIEQPESVSLSKLDDAKQRYRSHFDHKHGDAVKDSNRSNQHSHLLAVNVDFKQCRAIERKGVNSICHISSHLVNHMTDASVGLRVSVMPLWITLDQQMQGIRIRGNQRFGLLRNADIDDGGNTDSGQAAEGVAFCRVSHVISIP